MGRSRSRDRGRDRDRDRERRGRKEEEDKPKEKKKRSRSESSAERSREREKRRRRQQREFMQKHGGGKGRGKNEDRGGSGGGGGGAGAGSQQSRQGMFWDGFQWIPSEQSVNSAAVAAQMKLKRLYIGNVPPGVSEDMFKQQLIDKLRETEIITADRDSSSLELLIWMHPDQGYGFVQLENVEMAEKVLVRLDGMLVNGFPVQFKRPNDAAVAAKNIPGVNTGPLAIAAPPVCTSRVLQISEALRYDPFKTEQDEFEECLEDMVEGCSMHGKMNAANNKIIRPSHMAELVKHGLGDSVAVGHVFLEFVSMGDAAGTMTKMQNRKYDGRFLKYQSFPEDKFYSAIVPLPAA
ncbi:unnamed protein product [Amoebophrya sp. A120]|nr:unnamed protein product [Amoebophrya sp. A120]|eukprot:GSA120T00024803001.1